MVFLGQNMSDVGPGDMNPLMLNESWEAFQSSQMLLRIYVFCDTKLSFFISLYIANTYWLDPKRQALHKWGITFSQDITDS